MKFEKCIPWQLGKFSKWNDSKISFLYIFIGNDNKHYYHVGHVYKYWEYIPLEDIRILDAYILNVYLEDSSGIGTQEEDIIFLSKIKREMNINEIIFK